MENKRVIELKFEAETIGCSTIVDSYVTIIKVYEDGTKEIVPPLNDKIFRLSRVFDNLTLDIDKGITLKCDYDNSGNIIFDVKTKVKSVAVKGIYSSKGWNNFPLHPNERDLEELKKFLGRIKDTVEELKEQFNCSKKETFTL